MGKSCPREACLSRMERTKDPTSSKQYGYTDGGPGEKKKESHSLQGKPNPSRSPLSRREANAEFLGERGRKEQI